MRQSRTLGSVGGGARQRPLLPGRSVSRLHGRVQEIADRLLDAVAGHDRFDLIAALGYPLPVTVIAEMLGVPTEDMDGFEGWSNDIALLVEPILTPEQVERVRRATEELCAYFETIVEARRREPRDDLVSALLAADEEGDRLPREELLSTMLLILVAGNETTRNLIGNGMLALLRHPDQLERLRDAPGLLEPAVDELLRYDSPVQLDGRVVRGDLEMGGKRLRAGQKVIALLGAANRDPDGFENPEALDIGRKDEEPSVLWARHTLLPWRVTGGSGGADRIAGFARSLPVDPLGGRARYRDGIVLRGVESPWIEVEQARLLVASMATGRGSDERGPAPSLQDREGRSAAASDAETPVGGHGARRRLLPAVRAWGVGEGRQPGAQRGVVVRLEAGSGLEVLVPVGAGRRAHLAG